MSVLCSLLLALLFQPAPNQYAPAKPAITLKGHGHTINGKTLATGGIDRNISLWDVAGILKQHPVMGKPSP
jgi:hypothetical protein